MASEILIQINSEFDDSGIRKATQALERLINGATKGTRKSKSPLGDIEKLADSLENIAKLNQHVGKATQNMGDQVKKATGEASRGTKKLTEEQERNNQVLRENQGLLQRAKTMNRELAKDLDRRAQAERELRDIAKEARRIEEQRASVQQRVNRLIDSGTTDKREAIAATKELNQLEQRYNELMQRRSSARSRVNAAKEAQEEAKAVRDALAQLVRANNITTGPLVSELQKLDGALKEVGQRASRIKVDKATSELKKLGKGAEATTEELFNMEKVYNRLSNVNFGTLFSRSGGHLNTFHNNLQQTYSLVDRLKTKMDETVASSRQQAQEQRRAATAAAQAAKSATALRAAAGGSGPNQPPVNPSVYVTLSRVMQQSARAAQSFGAVLRSIQGIISRLANLIGSTLVSAIQRANAALGRFTSSGARFASLRSSLDATGRSFLTFGSQVEAGMARADRAMHRTAAGWSMIMAGQQGTQLAQTMYRNAERQVANYLGFEDAATLAAVATVNVGQAKEDGWLQEGDRFTPTRFIQELVFGAQRGQFGTPVMNLSSQQVAEGIYFYGSAIGQDIDPYNADQVMRNIVPMLQLAAFTQTAPETTIKGVLNAAQQFGIDPRDLSTGPQLRKVADLYGYLTNATSMELSDITNFFKMVGPQARIMSPEGDSMEALEEVMAWMYVASDYGLRGSQPARGLQQLLQTILSPSGPANQAAIDTWGMGVREKFFDPRTGTLKGGLFGLIEPFLELSEGEWLTVQSDMFTNNASRAIIPLIREMRNQGSVEDARKRWETLRQEIEDGTYLLNADAIVNQTLGAQLQNVANAWTQLMTTLLGSTQPEIFGFLSKFANGIREISDIFLAFPEMGKTFTAMYAGLASLLGLGGGLLTMAGSALILQRAFMIAGEGATIFLTALRAIPAVLAMSIPALALVAAGFVALQTAYKNNFLGLRDFVDGVRNIFSGDFSEKFLMFVGSETFENAVRWVLRLRDAFTELISGILFNTGDTNNLFALMQTMFGPRMGSLINYGLDTLRHKLSDIRTSIKGFFSDLAGGMPSLRDFGNALLGVFEALFTGGYSGRTFYALENIGEWLGIDELPRKIMGVARDINAAFRIITSVAASFGSILGTIFRDIGNNLRRIFTFENVITALGVAFNFVQGVILGFVSAISSAVLAVSKAVELITRLTANLGSVGRAINDVIQQVTGFRLELDNLAVIAGFIFGSRFASSILMAITPLRTLRNSITGLVALLGILGARAVLVGAQFAIMAAQFAVVRGTAAIVTTLTASMALLAAGTESASRSVTNLSRVFGVWALRMTGIVGILAVVAGGIYAFVAATQGLDRANQLARAFFDGFMNGLQLIQSAVQGAIGVITRFVQAVSGIAMGAINFGNWVMDLLGVSDAFNTAENAAKSFGTVIALLLGATIATATANIMKNILAMAGGFLNLGRVARPAVAAIGIGLLALGPHFDTVIGWVNKLIDALNNLEIAGIGVGDILAGIGLASTTKTGRKAIGTVGRFIQRNPAALLPMAMWMGYENLYAGEGGYDVEAALANAEGIYSRYLSSGDMRNAAIAYGDSLILDRGLDPNSAAYQKEMTDWWTQRQIEAIRQSGGIVPEGTPIYDPSSSKPEARNPMTSLTPEAAQFQKVYQAGRVGSIAVGLSALEGLSWMGGGGPSGRHADRIDYEADARAAASGSSSLVDTLFGRGSIGEQVASLFGMSSGDLAAMFGFTGDGGWSLDSFFDANGLRGFSGKYDDRVLDFMSPELRSFFEQRQKHGDFKEFAEKYYGGNERQAAIKWKDMTGEYPLLVPQTLGEIYGLDEEQAMLEAQKEAEYWQAFREHELAVQDAWLQADLPTMMRATMSGPSWITEQGNLARSVSGAEVIASWADAFMQNIGDSMPWMNTQEMLADAGIHGLLTKNMGGRNLHKAFGPMLEQWARESGIPVSDLLANVPKFFFDEQYMTQATADMAQMFAGMDREILRTLDTLGAGVYEEYGLKWQELAQYAIGQAMAGNTDWNLVDYIMEAWDMTRQQAEDYIAANGLDPNVVSGAMFEDTQGMINTQGGKVVALTQEWWDYLNQVTNDGTDRMIEISQEAYNALPDYVKAAYAQMGYYFVIGGEQNIQQATANVKMLEERLSQTYGEAFDAIADDIRAGAEEIGRVTRDGVEFVQILDEATGKVYEIPAVEYEAYKKSLEDAKKATEDFWSGFREAWRKGVEDAYAQGGGEGDGEYSGGFAGMGRWARGQVGGAIAGAKYAADYIKQGGAPELSMLGLPTLTDVESYIGQVSQIIQEGISSSVSGEGEGGTIKLNLSNLFEIDESALKSEAETIGTQIATAIQQGISTAFGAGATPAGSMSSDFEAGMVTSYTGGGASSPLAQQLVDSIVNPLKQELTTRLPQEINTALSEALNLVAGMIGAMNVASGVLGVFGMGDNLGIGASLGQAIADSISQSLSQSLREQLPAKINEAINSALSGISLGGGGGEGGFGGLGAALGGMIGGGGFGGGLNLEFEVKIGADLTNFNAAVQAVGTQGAALEAVTYTVKLDGDPSPFSQKVGSATQIGQTFESTTFTATLDGDVSPFSTAVGSATQIGQTFANSTFTATIAANADPFWATVNSISGSVVGTATIQVRAQVSGLGSLLSGFFADGGPVEASGMYMVGEEGPELVMLPKGAYVYNNDQTTQMLRSMAERNKALPQRPTISAGVNPSQSSTFRVNVEQKVTTTGQGDGPSKVEINFNGPVYARDENELRRMSKQVAQEVKKEIARDSQLAERGMVSVTIGRPIG